MITGAERRRRWNEEDRARILAAISEPGAVVAEVARAADVSTSLVYKWRREARAAALTSDAPVFASVVVEAPPAAALSLPPPPPTNAEPGIIVVEMREARIRIGADAPIAAITATLKALRQ